MAAIPHDSHPCAADGCTNPATHIYEIDVLKDDPTQRGAKRVAYTNHLLVCEQHLPTESVTRGPEPVIPCEHCGRWSASWRTLPEPCALCGKTGCLGCLNAHHAGEPLVLETSFPDPLPAMRDKARAIAAERGIVS